MLTVGTIVAGFDMDLGRPSVTSNRSEFVEPPPMSVHAIQNVVARVVPGDIWLYATLAKDLLKPGDEVRSHRAGVGTSVVETKVGVAEVVRQVSGAEATHRDLLGLLWAASRVQKPTRGARHRLNHVEPPGMARADRVGADPAVRKAHERDAIRIHVIVALYVFDHIEDVSFPHPAPHHLPESVW